MMIDMEDWEQFFADRAISEGWHITESGPIGSAVLLIESIVSKTDDDAVSTMKRAYEQCKPHAITAHDLLRRKSPDEFKFWKMDTWT